MKKTLTVIALTGVMAVAVLGFATSSRALGRIQNARSTFIQRHIEHELNLTDDQRAQIKAILVAERPAAQAILQKIEQRGSCRTKNAA